MNGDPFCRCLFDSKGERIPNPWCQMPGHPLPIPDVPPGSPLWSTPSDEEDE